MCVFVYLCVCLCVTDIPLNKLFNFTLRWITSMEFQNLEILGGLLLANIKLRGVLVLAPRVTAPSRAERAVPVEYTVATAPTGVT